MMIFTLIAAAALQPGADVPPRETSISDAANGGIREWHVIDDHSILLRDRSERWYRATFVGLCPGARSSSVFGVKTDALGAFDRFASIVTDRGPCAVASVVRSASPAALGLVRSRSAPAHHHPHRP